MRVRSSVQKVIALASSILLVAGCVTYHGGAFKRLSELDARSSNAENGSTSSEPDTFKPLGSTKDPSPNGIVTGLTPIGTTTTHRKTPN
jgi:hypothetical protein